jgi:hypothetical protein
LQPVSPLANSRSQGRRQPGWVVIVAMFGAACIIIGLMLLAMIQAPAVRPRVWMTGCGFLIAGVILLPIAWMRRVRRPSPSAAEHRAQEADNQPIPPNEA